MERDFSASSGSGSGYGGACFFRCEFLDAFQDSGFGSAKMVHSAIHTENKISGADNWSSLEGYYIEQEGGVEAFSKTKFELPTETLEAGDEMASVMAFSGGQGEGKDETEVEEEEEEKDPFAASEMINKPESLVEGFKKDKDQSSDLTKALAGIEVTTLPPAAATDSTHIVVEGFEGNYGGIEFSQEGSTLREDFEGINDAWGGGLDVSEYVESKKVKKQEGLGGAFGFISSSIFSPQTVVLNIFSSVFGEICTLRRFTC